MSNLSDIKRRIASVKQTRQITSAMETVSVAKMRKATDKLSGNRVYFHTLCEVMRAASRGRVDSDTDRRQTVKGGGKKITVVFSSDRGLCGGFDHDIFRFAQQYCESDCVIMPVGQTAAAYYRSRKTVDLRLSDFYVPEYATAEHIASILLDEYARGAASVTLIYSELLSRSTYRAAAFPLLPVAETDDGCGLLCADCEFEPSVGDIINVLTPMYVAGAVYGALLNNVAAEHCARHAAMSSATESADEVISRLSIEYNRARQSSVTEQIVEIIGSTAALKNQGAAVDEKRS